jgi:pimeloyl-ACP methyl ester carboxylesterase
VGDGVHRKIAFASEAGAFAADLQGDQLVHRVQLNAEYRELMGRPPVTDLADASIPVALIYGSHDLRVNDESIARRQHLLPADTRYVRIDGGDHHQFGSYEIKPQEHHATIDRAAQQKQIIEQTLNLIKAASQTE